jgi:DNA-binding NtrC family response regulator
VTRARAGASSRCAPSAREIVRRRLVSFRISMSKILLIDDEPDITAPLARFFERANHEVAVAHSADEGLAAYHRVHPDLVMVDVGLPDASGLDVLQRLTEEHAVAIMLTGRADVETAVEAMRRGAENFVTKPVELRRLGEVADRALEKARARELPRPVAAGRTDDAVGFALILGVSPGMRALADQIALVARSDRTVALLVGELGVGIGRVAEMIHAQSPRASRPLVHVDCAALPGELLDAELFGRAAQPLTGEPAVPGLVDAADGATLVIEEVTALDAMLQAKLLRLLEGRGVRRAGGTEEVRSTPRVIVSTRKDLATEVAMKRFREDLYYRLAVMPTVLPPLRARPREDLAAIIAATVDAAAGVIAGAPVSLSEGALDRMLRYAWPGNIDELRTVVERTLLVAHGSPQIRSGHLPPEVRAEKGGVIGGADEPYVPRSLADVERAHIERTLRAYRGNRTRAAELLGISRATLIKKIREYTIVLD